MLKHKKHGIEGAVAQTLLYLSLAVPVHIIQGLGTFSLM